MAIQQKNWEERYELYIINAYLI